MDLFQGNLEKVIPKIRNNRTGLYPRLDAPLVTRFQILCDVILVPFFNGDEKFLFEVLVRQRHRRFVMFFLSFPVRLKKYITKARLRLQHTHRINSISNKMRSNLLLVSLHALAPAYGPKAPLRSQQVSLSSYHSKTSNVGN